MKLQKLPYSERMGSRVRVVGEQGDAIAILEVKVMRQGLSTVQEVSEAVVNELLAQGMRTQDIRFREACDRLYDILLQDDGEAYSLAERFLKQHAPDLYNRIGVGTDRIAATGEPK